MEEQMVNISVKIPKKLKERIKRSRIKTSKVVRELLETKILEEEARKLNEDIKRHKAIFKKLSVEDVVKDLQEDRYKGH